MKLLVFLLLPCLSLSHVVKDFVDCRNFFLNGVPPAFSQLTKVTSGPQRWSNKVKEICQCLLDNNNQKNYYYATLYNTDWKIPVYSAYVFNRKETVKRKDRWYIEPKLDEHTEPCMTAKDKKTITNQAVNDDYEGQDFNGPTYDKGHLYPVQHTYDEASMLATSTLTNAAPQDACFNRLQWCNHETVVIEDLMSCNGDAYMVTGVVPDLTKAKLKSKVTVSMYYWRAYCCRKKNSQNEYIGQGYFGPDNNNKVQKLSIAGLQTQLAKGYGMETTIFPSLPQPPGPPPPPTPPPTGTPPTKKPRLDDTCI